MNYKIYSEVISPWLITLSIWIRTYIGLWVQSTNYHNYLSLPDTWLAHNF